MARKKEKQPFALSDYFHACEVVYNGIIGYAKEQEARKKEKKQEGEPKGVFFHRVHRGSKKGGFIDVYGNLCI